MVIAVYANCAFPILQKVIVVAAAENPSYPQKHFSHGKNYLTQQV